jgi:hypothetical protein
MIVRALTMKPFLESNTQLSFPECEGSMLDCRELIIQVHTFYSPFITGMGLNN